ncbi:RtcB family protein [Candidatus Marsarchaeota archaeon]|nr:RtcB family protein [Candidatus Marsarchaeota archaeon]MCL5404350.1 RtcB family protein [Candidatus Marsarchaeota archaeon]
MEVKINKINEFTWEIQHAGNPDNMVPVRIFANSSIISSMQRDRTMQQAMNATTLPTMVKHMLVMPDGHEGYGFPVGGVAAFPADDGIISPGAIGFDINCGVRLIRTDLSFEEVRPRLGELMDTLFSMVPSGVGSKASKGFTRSDIEKVAIEGAAQVIKHGFGVSEDLERMEENGCMDGADPDRVSDLAKKRGTPQLGTLGAGNHFLEVQRVGRILDPATSKAYGLWEDQVVVMVHSGSRGYGHQVCSDYLRVLNDYSAKNNIRLVDPELSYAHIGSKESEDYLKAMKCAVNFAFANRQVMMDSIRKSFEKVFSKSWDALGMHLVYDVAHNIAKEEEHDVEGRRMKLIVHRKGATRAFAPGRPEIPKIYRDYGQPVLIPGSMGTSSYVLAGLEGAMKQSFGSSCHGSGRLMSRHQAIREIPASKTLGSMRDKHIELRVRDRKLVSEESELAYKNVDDVVASVAGAGITKIVAQLLPIGVAKG